MSSLYDTYASQTGSATIDHLTDIHRVADHFRERLLPQLPVDLETCRIFEFGAGWGRNLLAMAELGAKSLCGIDISKEQVAIGRRLGLSTLELVSPDTILPLSMATSKFDVVLAIDVLEHLDLAELNGFIELTKKIIEPGGFLVVQVPNSLAPFNPVVAGDLTHVRAFSPASLRQLFAIFEADVVHLAGMPFPGRSLTHVVRRAAVRFAVAPMANVFVRMLYGRLMDPVPMEPNLLGVARFRGPRTP